MRMEEELNRMRILNHGEEILILVTEEAVSFAGMAFVQLVKEGIDPTIADMTLYKEEDREELQRMLRSHAQIIVYGVNEQLPWMAELSAYRTVSEEEDLTAAVRKIRQERMMH